MNGQSPPAEPPEQMHAELAALLQEVAYGELTSPAFGDQLTQIHTRYLGEEANAPSNESRRGLGREAPSRHHELELLAESLGVAASYAGRSR